MLASGTSVFGRGVDMGVVSLALGLLLIMAFIRLERKFFWAKIPLFFTAYPKSKY
jgi:hypothetical protein